MPSSIFPVNQEALAYLYKDNEIRVVLIDGEFYFVANDICKILELGNVTRAISRLTESEKGLTQIKTPGGMQMLNVVSEPGLYNLIFRSDKPEAQDFRYWVFHEVLPAIRKTGSYSIVQNPPSALDIAENMLITLRAHEDRMKRVEARQDAVDEKQAYFTIYGYSNYINRHLDDATAAQLGKRATRLSTQENVHIGSVKDAKYGQVKTYHEDILKRVFDAWYSQFPLSLE